MLICYALSLGLMVLLVNLPITSGDLGRTAYGEFDGRNVPSEPLPVITVQDVSHTHSRDRAAADEPVEPNRDLPPAVIDIPELAAAPSAETRDANRAEVLRPAAVRMSADLHSLERTHKLLRHTGGPPTVEEAPKLRVSSMIVRYPISALKKAIQGLVIVRFLVEPNGRASGVEVVHGLDPACDAEVVEAVQRARFQPGKSNGRTVPAYSQMTVRFVMAGQGRSGLF